MLDTPHNDRCGQVGHSHGVILITIGHLHGLISALHRRPFIWRWQRSLCWWRRRWHLPLHLPLYLLPQLSDRGLLLYDDCLHIAIFFYTRSTRSTITAIVLIALATRPVAPVAIMQLLVDFGLGETRN